MGPEVTLPGTSWEDVEPGEGGPPHRLLYAPPPGDVPANGFPVLYLLDGGAFFGTLVEMIRLRRNRPAMTGVAAALVVGLAHPGSHPYDRARRQAEYTRPEAAGEGRSDRFREFLLGDVRRRVAQRFPVDPGRGALVGHSLAGLFVLETLLRAPASFSAFLAISPSIWHDPESLDAGPGHPGVAPESDSREPTVVVAVGEYDQAVAPWQVAASAGGALERRREERGMVDRARVFVDRYSTAVADPGRVHFHVHPGEDHASVVPAALGRWLRVVAGEGGGRTA